MKGVVEIEFIIAVFVFITSISFVTLLIVSNVPLLHNTAVGESAKSRSYQYAELMIFDEGYPSNWSIEPFANIRRFGFSTGRRYFLDTTKIAQLNAFCNDITIGYSVMKNRFGVDNAHDIIIEAATLDGSPVAGGSTVLCGPPVSTTLRQQFSTNRVGLLPTGEIVKVKVTIIA